MSNNSDTAELSEPGDMLFPINPASIALKNDPLDIVLVEDIMSDAILTRISLDATKIPYKLRTIRKGNEVLSFLRSHHHSGLNQMPDLLLLDLGLPGMDGFEILSSLSAASVALRAVPIVIITGYEHFSYLQKIHNLCIAGYFQKPCNVEKMRETLITILLEKQLASINNAQ